MGKKIIITGADFSTNGIKENHIDFEVGTTQGIIYVTGNAEGSIGSTSNSYHRSYVHSTGKVIKLYPNDTLAVITKPNDALRVCILSYTSVTDVYPDNIATSTNYLRIGAYYKRTSNSSMLPAALVNDTDDLLYIAIDYSVADGSISTTAYPTIAYRIYTDNPENYEEEDSETEDIDASQTE